MTALAPPRTGTRAAPRARRPGQSSKPVGSRATDQCGSSGRRGTDYGAIMAPPRAWWLLVALAGICVSASAAPRRRGACASTARAADPAVFLGTAQSQGSSIGADRHGRRGVGGVGPDRYGRRGVASGCHPILMYHVVSAPPPGAAYPQLWVPQRRFEESALAGGEIVEADHGMAEFEESIDEVAPDESRRAGDERPHGWIREL